MSIAVLNVKIDPRVKLRAHKIAEELGMSLSGVVNVYLRELIRTKTIYTSIREEVPSARLVASIRAAAYDRKHGLTHSFDNVGDAISYLDKLVAKKK